MAAIAAEIAVPLLILAAWQAWTVHANDPLFPRLSTILVQFKEMWLFSQFHLHVVPSLIRIGAGFTLAVIIGLIIGIPLGLSRWGRLLAMPHIEWWRAMPPPALLPISILLLHSIGDRQKISFIAFFCLFPILLNTIDGVRGIDPTLIETTRSYGVGGFERIRRVVLPAALPQIFAGMRTSLSLAVIMMVLTEYFSSERSRLRPPHLEEHVSAGSDVGGDRADRRPRLSVERPLDPRRAPRPRVAPRLAGGGGAVSTVGRRLLEIRHVSKTYGSGDSATHAIADVSFAVDDREFVCVVGPSGCGKTTLLKCVGGLLAPTNGDILLRGTRVTSPPEEMALVFQEYGRSLMPWSTVRNNVLLPLRHKKLTRQKRNALVEEALEAVGLTPFIDRYPWQLSGGMQQRVAIARALAYQPAILLMDEPFASVDAQTRGDLEDLILRVREEFAITILFVTHDIDESVYLSDRVIVLTHGPTEVKASIDVDLPFPRDQIATKELPDFAHLRGHVYRLIKREQVESGEELAATLKTATKGDRP